MGADGEKLNKSHNKKKKVLNLFYVPCMRVINFNAFYLQTMNVNFVQEKFYASKSCLTQK
jgi:hypothetical protein